MAHGLIAGMTLSGKTTLARQICAQYKRAGIECLVLDPVADPRWPTEYRTSDQDTFLDWYWHSRCVVAFMDEGGESVGRYNDAMTKTATRGRHWGHRNYYIVQKPTQLASLVRDQCTHLYLFACGVRAGELLAEEWNHAELAECGSLKTGEFFYAVKMGGCVRHSLFNQRSNDDATRSSDNRRHTNGARSHTAGKAEASGNGADNDAAESGAGDRDCAELGDRDGKA